VPSPLSSEVLHDQDSPPRTRARRSSSAGRYPIPYEPTGYDYSAYPAFPTHNTHNNHKGYSQVPADAFPSLPYDQYQDPLLTNTPDKAIVGDNGYPHMNVPRRKSGGEYDVDATGPLGPQTLQSPDSSPQSSRKSTMKSNYSNDDANWRISDGMPGGWQRSSFDGAGGTGRSPRTSRDLEKRDSGFGPAVGMNAGRRRMRASDVTGTAAGEGGYGQAM
jgi:hypothetical protein